jgi:hypothetical protein
VIDAVAGAAARGVKTYVVNLAAEDMLLTQHLQNVAQAGDTGEAPFAPSDQAALVQALDQIVGTNTSCDVLLAQAIDEAASCRGTVQIGGEAIACNTPDGYVVVDGSLLRLSGAACTRYKEKQTELQVSIPCTSVKPL